MREAQGQTRRQRDAGHDLWQGIRRQADDAEFVGDGGSPGVSAEFGSFAIGEPCRQLAQRHAHLRSASRIAVSARQYLGLECGESTDRLACRAPIRREVRGRPMQFRPLRGHGEDRLLLDRGDRIAGDQEAIAFAVQRDVPGRVARRRDPLPAWQTGHRSTVAQPFESISDVNRPARIESRGEGQRAAADERVRRRIRRAPGQVRPLEGVREHRDIPRFYKGRQRADVIEMPMRQDDGGGRGNTPQEFARHGADVICVSPQAGVDQHPVASLANQVDVGDQRPEKHHAGRDLSGIRPHHRLRFGVTSGSTAASATTAASRILSSAPPACRRYRPATRCTCAPCPYPGCS